MASQTQRNARSRAPVQPPSIGGIDFRHTGVRQPLLEHDLALGAGGPTHDSSLAPGQSAWASSDMVAKRIRGAFTTIDGALEGAKEDDSALRQACGLATARLRLAIWAGKAEGVQSELSSCLPGRGGQPIGAAGQPAARNKTSTWEASSRQAGSPHVAPVGARAPPCSQPSPWGR